MAAEYEKIRGDKEIIAAATKSGYRVADVANALKKRYGTSGHSLTDEDQSMEYGFRVIGFIDFNSRGINVTRYEEETPSGLREEVKFTWSDYAKTVIFYIKEEAEAKAFSAGEAKARSGSGKEKQKQEEKTMTMLANKTETRALTLADYEARIHLYKEQIGTGYIGIGRTLLEAKEAKVVPHGQWESWVTETTGLTPRQAQRCMQAATEIKDGSAMARLEMSKALMLLGSGLDEDAREEIAEKAVEEGATVKDLREQLRQAKLKIVQETGAATEIRDALRKAEADRKSLELQLKATIDGYQERMDEESEKAYQRGVDDMSKRLDDATRRAEVLKKRLANVKEELWDEVQHEYETRLDKVNAQNATLNDRLKAARKEAEEEVEEEMKALRQDREVIMAAAAEAEKRAADAEAELEALRAGQDPAAVPLAVVLARALGTFFGECDSMPWFVSELQETPGPILNSVGQLEDWCSRMRAAVGSGSAIKAEGAIV